MTEQKHIKVYVPVSAEFGIDGRIVPHALHWEDGRTYKIDKVLECKPAATMKAGGCGDRYRVRINGQERYIFFERSGELTGPQIGRWFVEKLVS